MRNNYSQLAGVHVYCFASTVAMHSPQRIYVNQPSFLYTCHHQIENSLMLKLIYDAH